MTATMNQPEVGRSRLRKEDARLVTGRTRWTDNSNLPGMVHLAILRSPYAHARITRVDLAGGTQPSQRDRRVQRCRPGQPGRPGLRLAGHGGHGRSDLPTTRGRRGAPRRRAGRGRGGAGQGERGGRARSDRRRLRAVAGGARLGGGPAARFAAGARRRWHQQDVHLDLRLGRCRLRRQLRRSRGRGRGGHQAPVRAAAVDSGLHGAAQRHRRPER